MEDKEDGESRMEWTPIDVSDAHQEALGSYHVVAALEGMIPWVEEQAAVYYQAERKLDVLERFVIRCLVELEPIQSVAEISDILGLGDEQFVEPVTSELTRMQLLRETDEGFRPTDELRASNEKGVWVDQYDQTIWSVCNPFTGRRLSKRPDFFEHIDVSTEDDVSMESDVSVEDLPLEETGLDSLQAWATSDDGPLQDTTITKASMNQQRLVWEPFQMLIFEDHHERAWGWEPYNPRKQRIARAYREACDFFGATDYAHEFLSALPDGDAVASEDAEERTSVAETVRDRRNLAEQEYIHRYGTTEAAAEINKAIAQAEKEVLISFPWIKSPALTSELTRALSSALGQGASIYVGYGISESPGEEDSHPDAIQRLRALAQDTEGSVRVVWTGESHVKEIVIDRSVYLGGSFNRLSFRGDPNRSTGNVRRESMIHTNAGTVIESSIHEFVPILRDALAKQIRIQSGAFVSNSSASNSEAASSNGSSNKSSRNQPSDLQLANPQSYAQWRKQWRPLFRLGARPEDIRLAFAELPGTGRKYVSAVAEILGRYQPGGNVPPETVIKAVLSTLQQNAPSLTEAARQKLYEKVGQFTSDWSLDVDANEKMKFATDAKQ